MNAVAPHRGDRGETIVRGRVRSSRPSFLTTSTTPESPPMVKSPPPSPGHSTTSSSSPRSSVAAVRSRNRRPRQSSPQVLPPGAVVASPNVCAARSQRRSPMASGSSAFATRSGSAPSFTGTTSAAFSWPRSPSSCRRCRTAPEAGSRWLEQSFRDVRRRDALRASGCPEGAERDTPDQRRPWGRGNALLGPRVAARDRQLFRTRSFRLASSS